MSQLDIKLGQTQSDTRRTEREQHSYEARIESLEDQREEYRTRLQQYAGNDDLLRVSFKRTGHRTARQDRKFISSFMKLKIVAIR